MILVWPRTPADRARMQAVYRTTPGARLEDLEAAGAAVLVLHVDDPVEGTWLQWLLCEPDQQPLARAVVALASVVQDVRPGVPMRLALCRWDRDSLWLHTPWPSDMEADEAHELGELITNAWCDHPDCHSKVGWHSTWT